MEAVFTVEKKRVRDDVREILSIFQDEHWESPRDWTRDAGMVWSGFFNDVDEYSKTLSHAKHDEVLDDWEYNREYFEVLNELIEYVKEVAPKGAYCQRLVFSDNRYNLSISKVGDPVLVSSLKKLKNDKEADEEFSSNWMGIMFTRGKELKSKKDKLAAINCEFLNFKQFLAGEVYVADYKKEIKCDKCGEWKEDTSDAIGGIYASGYGEELLEDILASCEFGTIDDYDLSTMEE